MGDVNAGPAPRGHIQTHIAPGVAGQFGGVGGVEIATHVARRNAQPAANGHHDMGLVLANACAGDKRLQRCGGDIGGA